MTSRPPTAPLRLAACWLILAVWLVSSVALLWRLERDVAPTGAYCRTASNDTGAPP